MGDLKVYVIAFIFKKMTKDFLHFPLLFCIQWTFHQQYTLKPNVLGSDFFV